MLDSSQGKTLLLAVAMVGVGVLVATLMIGLSVMLSFAYSSLKRRRIKRALANPETRRFAVALQANTIFPADKITNRD